MRRREFISLLGGAAVWPVTARAQQPAMPVVGYLNSGSPDLDTNLGRAFRQGLSETGYVGGRNVTIEYRSAEDHIDRLPALADELVRRPVTVVVASGVLATAAVKAATTAIPIVFNMGVDPVERGFVVSLNRPGRNLTGVTTLGGELGPKRLELLHEVVPGAAIIGALVNPTNPNAETLSRDTQAAARTLGLQVHVLNASTEGDIDTAFATLVQLRAGALMIGADASFNRWSEQLAAGALRLAMPAIYQYREFAAAGGLMSYGSSLTDGARQVGVYTGRILKGEKPADLPVMQPTKFDLIINLKTAKALGLTIPESFLLRADEVIE
jgi:putative tryptophan/tyrosine transport system substrate-binding protein